MSINKTLIKVYSQYWKDILLFLLIGVVLSFLELLGISIVLPILDGSSSETKIPFPLSIVSDLFIDIEFSVKLIYIAIILLIIYLLKGIFFYINGVLGANLEKNISINYQLLCYKGITNVKVGYLDGGKEADLFTKSVTYAGSFGNVIRLISNIFPLFMTLILLLATLLFISPIMLTLSLLIGILSSILIKRLHKKSELAGQKIALANKKLNFVFIEEISGIKTRRLSNSINQSISFIEKSLHEWGTSLVGVARIQVLIRPIIEFIGIIALALILFVFSYFLVDSDVFADSSATILTFLLIFTRILTPITAINSTIASIKSNMPYFKETEKFLSDLDDNKIKDGKIEKQKLNDYCIEFQSVFFRYSQSTSDILSDISFVIPSGSKVGIVGLSGSGKSSLVDLLLRYYEPSSGKIIIDGTDLKELKLSSWYKILGVVSQTPFFFDETIFYNISFNKDSSDMDKVINAAKKAHIHEFIQTLPEGYETVVGGRGELLSGGQRQRIAIARALFNDPSILIFDEATSALDTETETEIQLALNQLSSSKTVIMVAHRLSTIMGSNIIIVMDEGKIIQFGHPNELINQKNGKFYQLLSEQLNGHINSSN